MKTKNRPNRLKVKNISGAGLQIHADISFNPDFKEFTLKKGFQPIMQGDSHETSKIISYEPWVQFPDKDWDEMLSTVFSEMVDLWNDKYALPEEMEMNDE